MSKRVTILAFYIAGLVACASFLLILEGCREDQYPESPVKPAGSRSAGVALKFLGGTSSQTKAVGLTIEAEAINEDGTLTGEQIDPVNIPNPQFPLEASLQFFVPPCTYRITVTVDLSRPNTPPRVKTFDMNVCNQESYEVKLDTFEDIIIFTESPINAPASAMAGEPITVSCGPIALSAPDIDRAQPRALLQETLGESVEGPIDTENFVSREFSDPYAISSNETQRVFTCTISDEQTKTATYTATVYRVLPTPTPTPTPTPIPEYTLSVNIVDTYSFPPVPGAVTANTGGISCAGTCSAAYQEGTSVNLTPAASLLSSTYCCSLLSWSGCSSVSGDICTVNVNSDVSVTATFDGCGGC